MTNWTNVSSCPFSITLCAEDIMDSNATAEHFEYPVHLFPVPILTGITVTCSFLFLVGIAGNLLTILVVTKYKDMRTTTNLYLCSMALSDLLIFLCMPLDLYRVWRYRPWNFAVVVLAFVLCWLPFHVGRYLFSKSSEANSPLISQISEYCNLVSFVLFYLSAAINPILYNIMSKKYRSAACKLFRVKRAPRRSVQSFVNAESFSVWNEYSWST
ncbi:growth hormone secretagogue receptor type 1-like [Sinocyclocheilus grahami]|uniref:growth hormone secretagogue receptor type 1-like n=1 Tax=Sinocyclocheilus grahami TaxID=75366 RepID=UPI0007ACD77F|nr:PREDICTED: growth hormone secretagogue receptor type 1-like [Sinocyclocheilus grahami]